MRFRPFFTYTLITLIIAGAGVGYFFYMRSPATHQHSLRKTPVAIKLASSGKTDIFLYYANKQVEHLSAEKRSIEHSPDATRHAQAIIGALFNPPRQNLVRTIPPGTRLRALYVTADQSAYVDFSKEIQENHPGGCAAEIMTIYSIVNSLVLNSPAITKVKILVDGSESETLAGHIDLSRPFKANLLIIR